MKKSSKSKSSAGSPKLKTETVIAILGIVATLLAAVIPIVWSSLSERSVPPPANNMTSTLPAFSSNETPGLTSTEASVIPSQAPDSSGLLNSKDVAISLVPAGEFTTGSDADDSMAECQKYKSDCDRSWYEDEEPPHIVSLDAFYIDTYEVTNALYAACVNAEVCQRPTNTGSNTQSDYYGNPDFDNFPVIYVDWNMAKTYCEWRGTRLPTEAEWEKAARGADRLTYPWGDNIEETFANYGENIGDTTLVDSYENGKSPYGVYNMAGNVWEWVADFYSETYYQNLPSSIFNPLGPDSGQERVLRGGSWYDTEDLIRTTVRLKEPNPVDNNFGIRCARSAP